MLQGILHFSNDDYFCWENCFWSENQFQCYSYSCNVCVCLNGQLKYEVKQFHSVNFSRMVLSFKHVRFGFTVEMIPKLKMFRFIEIDREIVCKHWTQFKWYILRIVSQISHVSFIFSMPQCEMFTMATKSEFLEIPFSLMWKSKHDVFHCNC